MQKLILQGRIRVDREPRLAKQNVGLFVKKDTDISETNVPSAIGAYFDIPDSWNAEDPSAWSKKKFRVVIEEVA